MKFSKYFTAETKIQLTQNTALLRESELAKTIRNRYFLGTKLTVEKSTKIFAESD